MKQVVGGAGSALASRWASRLCWLQEWHSWWWYSSASAQHFWFRGCLWKLALNDNQYRWSTLQCGVTLIESNINQFIKSENHRLYISKRTIVSSRLTDFKKIVSFMAGCAKMARSAVEHSDWLWTDASGAPYNTRFHVFSGVCQLAGKIAKASVVERTTSCNAARERAAGRAVNNSLHDLRARLKISSQ